MKICPIALAVGCKKCPVFKICPVKTLIGDAPKAQEPAPMPAKNAVTRKPVAAKKAAPARKKAKK